MPDHFERTLSFERDSFERISHKILEAKNLMNDEIFMVTSHYLNATSL